MRNKFIYISMVIISLLPVLTACKKFVEVPNPPDRIISDEVFTDDNKATSAVTGIYGSMINGTIGFSNGLTSVFPGLSSDELDKYNPTTTEQEFVTNQLNPNNVTVQNFWTSIYQHIYYANACIEGIQKSKGISDNTMKQLTGECKFIRAFCYFYLTNLFGDAPLVLTTDYHANSILAKSPRAEIYQLIVSDLTEAKTLLPTSYISTEKVRPNKWVASALLARVYLFNRDWSKAEAESNEIINSGSYTPLPSLQTTFLKNSKEAIWQLLPKNGFVPEINQVIPIASAPRIFLTSSMLQSFSSGDQRRTRWIDSITYLGTKYYYPGKYKAVTANNTEYYMVLRIAEQFLIRAEARANLNNLSGAITDLNQIRSRATLSNLPGSLTQTELLQAIETERRNELFSEWGHRWFDLKRTDRASAILSAIKPGWQSTDTLYPVPLNEILSNPNLTQNNGY